MRGPRSRAHTNVRRGALAPTLTNERTQKFHFWAWKKKKLLSSTIDDDPDQVNDQVTATHSNLAAMGKSTARFGFKSGILPKPRKIVEPFKTPAELRQEAQNNVGFVDPELVPKGVAAHVPLKERVPASYKIAHSAKEKTNKEQRADWKELNATVRRRYLTDSLTFQEAEELKIMQRREKRLEKLKELNEKRAKQAVRSEATTLTLPTIESFLTIKNQLVTPRTKEETELLQAKRTANRKEQELRALERKSETLLEVYQSAGEFIVTEAQLDSAIEKAFRSTSSTSQFNFSHLGFNDEFSRQLDLTIDPSKSSGVKGVQADLTQSMFGVTSNKKPGLGEIEDAVSGATVQYRRVLRDLTEKKKAEAASESESS